jgi:hypothetical protein
MWRTPRRKESRFTAIFVYLYRSDIYYLDLALARGDGRYIRLLKTNAHRLNLKGDSMRKIAAGKTALDGENKT